ncbi:MAG: ROK family protein [Ardenticatenaceae bacterium]|nr:ROK family protein [Anaerolineales bacterium]MCB8938530.1 ROK family protein [Ardenticatenaceae bacterium]MCB8973663.1 ROK family protein [Ardenticatenaceae bacterium]
MIALGIDIGGSGIKGALVDTEKGEMVTDRLRIPTPQPAKPEAVIGVLKQIVDHFEYSGPIGVGIPAIVINGVTWSAANIDDEWIGFPAQQMMAEVTGCPVILANDADVAGVAVMRFGAGKDVPGTVMIFTLGTGIGSAVFVNGHLVPNTELGHVYLRGQKKDAENHAAERIREEKNLTWKQWGKRLNTYFQHIEFLFSPELIIIGGGVSKKHEEFLHFIKTRATIIPAELRNEAGIIGAAVLAAETS